MLYFMKPLPDSKIDTTDWTPFIKNEWFRNHFMYFVYCLQAYVMWINAMIAGSDIINSALIAIKPNNSLFYRGYYK